ncbi:glutamyl aminopeptidase [Tuanshanicoccus lijuaniae]|uniref:glutamyl aminopeptidase n=1 Tax=Aerococcaceae bacterium zg-1292 TaxID=2774330 RepID=UPI001936816C|nr:glutamyl aminopeptidase [Aerococcaceae bacterium zg-1292]QQA36832.1 glutamyl aminopeptidase [Aerococcaceae bacterium zg-1292]
MNDQTFQLIKQLTEVQGISGNEGRVRDVIREKMTPLVDEVHQSPLGNLFGVKHSQTEDAPRLMVAAHMDEVGFMISRITDNGLFAVIPVGGWNPYSISAQRYTLQTKKGDYVCISSSVAPHLLKGKSEGQSVKAEDILFDAGFTSKEEALEYGVRPGDAIVPQTETVKTANGKNIISKAWDNRYGCAVMLETLASVKDLALPNHLIAGASVQEEVGLRGIKGAVHQFQPDLFLAVDCSPAGDTEGKKDEFGQLGQGFLLRMQDPGHITHKGLRDYLLDMAESNHIPYQYFFSKGGTDAGAAHVMNNGVPSGVIGVPGRYIHGHQTLFSIADYEAARELLLKIVTTFDRTTLNSILKQG